MKPMTSHVVWSILIPKLRKLRFPPPFFLPVFQIEINKLPGPLQLLHAETYV